MRTKTNKIVVHCSATPGMRDIGRDEIDRWHKERGWSGIGYHFVIRLDGRIERGREIDAVGAHVRGHNSDSIGICMIGGLDHHSKPAFTYTPAQLASMTHLAKSLQALYPGAAVVGHRDLDSGKECPCFDVEYWDKGITASIRRAVATQALRHRPYVQSGETTE